MMKSSRVVLQKKYFPATTSTSAKTLRALPKHTSTSTSSCSTDPSDSDKNRTEEEPSTSKSANLEVKTQAFLDEFRILEDKQKLKKFSVSMESVKQDVIISVDNDEFKLSNFEAWEQKNILEVWEQKTTKKEPYPLVPSWLWNWEKPLKLLRTKEKKFVPVYPCKSNPTQFLLISDISSYERFLLDYRKKEAIFFYAGKSGDIGSFNRMDVKEKLQSSTNLFKDELEKFEEIWYFSGLFVMDKSLVTSEMYNLFGNCKHQGMRPEERKLVISKGETPKKILDFANKGLENQENEKKEISLSLVKMKFLIFPKAPLAEFLAAQI
eukprot:GHVP01056851.1.p1 GENE.GHVP01056851.1~~GHVP01056851.1.p1  ORF type:complete len:323 (+),score=54.80 GHVP01056851.1:151-1119(+)